MTQRLVWLSAVVLGVLVESAPAGSANLVRNASFELDRRWNGTFMCQESEYYLAHARRGEKLAWFPTSAEGWWVEGPDADGVAVTDQLARSGRRCLVVNKPKAIVSAFDRRVNKGPVILRVWVKTVEAKGTLQLETNNGWRPMFDGPGRRYRKETPLPVTSDWSQYVLVLDNPEDGANAQLRLVVEQGTVYLDDAQIEVGDHANAFDLRPQEWLRLELTGTDPARLPMWIEGDGAVRTVVVHNDSRLPLGGRVELFYGPWNQPKARMIAEFDASEVKPGRPKTVEFKTEQLIPNAYVVGIKLQNGPDGAKEFNPKEPVGGMVSNSQMKSRMVVRFVIAPKTRPTAIFGVGNGMLPWGGNWFAGYNLDDYTHARELGVVCSRGPHNDDICFLTAAGGMPIHATELAVDQGPDDPSQANPAEPGYIDIYNPKGMDCFVRKAQAQGKEFGANPMVATCQMANEKHYMHNGSACPSAWADEHFRRWCKKRHGDLNTLNRNWGTKYTDWNQVEQIVSARFVEEEKKRPKLQGAAAIDWTAAARSIDGPVLERMHKEPGRGMDWLRWRTENTLWMYSTFRENAKQFDAKTLYSTNLPWPNFWPQMFMPFIRAMDVTMVDFMYTTGWPKSLGTPMEMLEIAEMSESTDRSKPFWGIEIYVQPSWPGPFAGFQNWAMVAHGMACNLVFAWKPYADDGPIAGPKAWEKTDTRPMWFLIDTDGTKLPAYESYKRTIREIEAFHKKYDFFSTKRAATDTAIYVSPDTAEYVVFETGNKPWGSCWTRTRSNLAYVLRLSGIVADYVDDATLPEAPGKFTRLIVPAAYVLNPTAAAKIAAFAKSGGTVVLAGVSGIYDPWLKKYDTLGGPAWAELNWRAPKYKPDFAKVIFAKDLAASNSTRPLASEKPGTMGGKIDDRIDESKTFRGVNFGTVAGAEPIRDTAGNIVGWTRPWGKGKLIAYGVFPDTYVTNPHPSINVSGWVRDLIARAGLTRSGWWLDEQKPDTAGHLGSGNAVVEVVVREKSPDEIFVFAFNQGGKGEGQVRIHLGQPGPRTARDVMTEKESNLMVGNNGFGGLRLTLNPWDYRVFRVTKTK